MKRHTSRPAPAAATASASQAADRATAPIRPHALIRACLLATAASLGGCASTGPETPRLALVDARQLKLSEAPAPAVSTQSPWPRQDWWLALKDDQLNTLIAEALASGLDPVVADARLRQARAMAGIDEAAMSPRLDARFGWQGSRQSSQALAPSEGGGHFKRKWEGSLGLDWTPDLWGGRHAAWAAALGAVRAAEVSAQDARIQLTVAVAQAYMQLAYAHVQGDIARAEQERVAEVHRLTQQRVSSGLGTQAQLRQTDSDIASAAQQGLMAQRLVSMAQATLSVLLGKGPDRGAAIARPSWPSGAPFAAPEWLPLELLSRRADVVAARWQVESAQQHIKTAKTAFLPNLNLAALVGVAATQWTDLLRRGSGIYELSPALGLPIFDAGRRGAELALQEARYDEAVAHYNQTVVKAVNEVADQMQAQRSLAAQLEQQQRAREAAHDAWQMAEQRYKAGVGSYLDALSVRQQLLQAEQRLAALQAQRIQDGLQLVKALGGGFHAQEQEPVQQRQGS